MYQVYETLSIYIGLDAFQFRTLISIPFYLCCSPFFSISDYVWVNKCIIPVIKIKEKLSSNIWSVGATPWNNIYRYLKLKLLKPVNFDSERRSSLFPFTPVPHLLFQISDYIWVDVYVSFESSKEKKKIHIKYMMFWIKSIKHYL